MKINKLVVTFFTVIGLLTDVHGVEDSRDSDSKSQRIHDIKSQISPLQQELYNLEQPPNNNNINMSLLAGETVDMDNDTVAMSRRPIFEDVQEYNSVSKCNWKIGCCVCTTVTALTIVVGGIWFFSAVLKCLIIESTWENEDVDPPLCGLACLYGC
jgi:hypothetical protein